MGNPATPLGLVFVAIWCTGYLAGKLAVAESGPFTTLMLRFGIAALLFAALALRAGTDWGTRLDRAHSAAVGCLQLAMQFGGMYVAFMAGAGAGMAALFTGLMPMAVAVISGIIGDERLRGGQWLGMGLGLAGVFMVAADRIDADLPPLAWLGLTVSLLGVSLGTVYQKRHAAAIDLRASLAIQHGAAWLLMLPAALCIEGPGIAVSVPFLASLAWLVVVNSLGGFGLLFVLIRRGAATQVAALFFLMPPLTALLGYWILDEPMSWLKSAGFASAAAGVWLATRRHDSRQEVPRKRRAVRGRSSYRRR